MVAIELPAPGVGRRGDAHEREVVEFLVEPGDVVVELFQRLVCLADGLGELEAARAQRGAHQAKGSVTLFRRHLLQADPLARVDAVVDVEPAAPFAVADAELCAQFLRRRQRCEEGVGG